MACLGVSTVRLVSKRHSSGLTPSGGLISQAITQVTVSVHFFSARNLAGTHPYLLAHRPYSGQAAGFVCKGMALRVSGQTKYHFETQSMCPVLVADTVSIVFSCF
jgi:hypothetical protein